MNAQSNALEYAFKRNGVPYKIIGGTKFFDRAEVKDMLAYLCVINNPADDLRLRRIVNVPARKIGAATMDKAQVIATEEGLPLMEVLRRAGDYPQLKASAGKLMAFTAMADEMRRQADDMGLVEFYEYVCRRSGYVGMLQEKNDMESRGRLENVEELSSSIQAFLENDPENPTLSGFLDEVALYTDLDSQEAGDNCVTLMTMHSAKGLEFPSVFVVGMEDGLFPGNRAMGEPSVLCGHDPGQGEADPDQRPAADAVRTHHSLHALPVSEGDPGGEHGVAGEARAPSGVLLGRFRRWACLCAAAGGSARCGASGTPGAPGASGGCIRTAAAAAARRRGAAQRLRPGDGPERAAHGRRCHDRGGLRPGGHQAAHAESRRRASGKAVKLFRVTGKSQKSPGA